MDRTLAIALLSASLASPLAGCSAMLAPEDYAPWENAENFCYAYADLLAEEIGRCAPGTTAWANDNYLRLANGLFDCAQLSANVDAGRTRYDASAGERCLSVMAAGGCRFTSEAVTTVCDAVFRGAGDVGGWCTSEMECGPATAGCSFAYGGTCPGSCVPYGQLGSACGGTAPPCAADLYCNYLTSPTTCADRRPIYATCDVGDPPGTCEDGLYCGYDIARRCLPRPGLGEPCDASKPCDDRLRQWCDPVGGVCVSVTGPSPIGGRCDSVFYCDYSVAWCDGAYCQARKPLDQGLPCSDNGMCAFGGHCVVHPDEIFRSCQSRRRVGESCWGGLYDCVDGAYCEAPAYAEQGTCRADPGPGESCAYTGGPETLFCLGGWCDSTSQLCRARLGAGDACDVDRPCDPEMGLVCDTGVTNVCIHNVCGIW